MSSPHILEQPLAETVVSKRPRRILIVEDDVSMAEVLRIRLEGQGYQAVTVHTGDDGMTAARRERPDLVLLDLRLPDIDGFTVCQNLVDSPETSDIPVIILSGMERPDIIRRSRAVGCQYFVRKPYDPNALLILISHAIDEAQRWADW